MIHFPCTGKHGGIGFDVLGRCTKGKFHRFKGHFFSVDGYSNGRHAEMLEVKRIFLGVTVKGIAID
jgi:hypothetical protein